MYLNLITVKRNNYSLKMFYNSFLLNNVFNNNDVFMNFLFIAGGLNFISSKQVDNILSHIFTSKQNKDNFKYTSHLFYRTAVYICIHIGQKNTNANFLRITYIGM